MLCVIPGVIYSVYVVIKEYVGYKILSTIFQRVTLSHFLTVYMQMTQKLFSIRTRSLVLNKCKQIEVLFLKNTILGVQRKHTQVLAIDMEKFLL